MKRGIIALLSILLLIGAVAAPMSVTAAERETVLISFSDFQPNDGLSAGKNRLQNLLTTLEIHGITQADGLMVVGDYNTSGSYADPSSTPLSEQGMAIIRQVFSPVVGNKMLFTQGNHDQADVSGLCSAGNNDPSSGTYGVFVIQEDQFVEWGNNKEVTEQAAAALGAYLKQKVESGWNKPIFVLNHIPLHWGNRTLKDGSGTYANLIFDVLNEYGGKGLNIIYLFGHNHSSGYDDFLGGSAIYLKKGDRMEVAQGNKYEHKTCTLNFTYMNAGYVGYNSTTEATADSALTLSVFRIKGNEVIITRYDAEFNVLTGQNGVHNLKSAGVWNSNFSEEGYHATPNTTVYASSRKVTTTGDVAVDPPMPGETTTTTTKKPTTTTKGSGVAVTKTTTGKSTTKTSQLTSGPLKTEEGKTTTGIGGITAPTDAVSAPTSATAPQLQEGTQENVPVPEDQPESGTESSAVTEKCESEGLSALMLALIGAGGVLVLLAVGVGIYLLMSKKKKK